MDVIKLECPSCGGSMKESNGKTVCDYCGREVIIESKSVEAVSKAVSNSIHQTGEMTQEVIKIGTENTQIELRRLQLAQELSTLQMQLSNLRSEKRSLTLQKQTSTHKAQLKQINEEEKNLIARIDLLHSTQYPQPNQPGIVAPITTNQLGNPRSQTTAFILAFFLGLFGAHRFYTGHNKLGVLYLLTAGVGGMGWAIDMFLLLFNAYKDADGRPLKPMGTFGIKLIVVFFVGSVIFSSWIQADPNASPMALIISFGIPLAIVNFNKIWGFTSKKLETLRNTAAN